MSTLRKMFRRNIGRTLCIGYFVATLACVLRAEADEALMVEGLSFVCPGCAVKDDGNCVVPVADASGAAELTLLPCDKAVTELLKSRAADLGSYRGENPNATELTTFLIRSKRGNAEQVKSCFDLLIADSKGRKALAENAAVFFKSYPDQIISQIKAGRGDAAIREAYYVLPEADAVAHARLRAAIAATDGGKSLDDLFNELSGVNAAADLQMLELYREALVGVKADWESTIAKTIEVIKRCEDLVAVRTVDICDADKIKALGVPAAPYLQRLAVQRALQRINNERLEGIAVLRIFSKLNYQEFSTPELFGQAEDAVLELLNSKFQQGRTQALQEDSRKMLIYFSKSDPIIADRLQMLILKTAEETFFRDEVRLAIGFLQESFSARPTYFEERLKLLKRLSEFEVIRNNSELKKWVDELIERDESQSPTGQLLKKVIGGLIAVLVLIVGVYFFKIKKGRGGKAATTTQNALSSEERQELRELLAFFQLKPNATLGQLTQFYRTKAKSLHPDANQEGASSADRVEQFSAVNEKYRRAKELLEKRTRN